MDLIPAHAPAGAARRRRPVGHPRSSRARSRRPGFRLVLVRPQFERLEALTLLSASLVGTVAGGATGAGLPGQTVFLDLNGDHRQDSTATTIAAASDAIGPAPGQLGALTGAQMASLTVAGVSTPIADLKLALDLANNGADPVQVGLVSPTGLNVPDFPLVFAIEPGEHFVGSFDQAAATPVTLAPRPLAPGTYIPQQLFTLPAAHVYDSDPNGTWGLVFLEDPSALTLSSWSLTFTTPEPAATTDAHGNYTFTGLAPGPYLVGLAPTPGATQTAPAGGAEQAATLADGQTAQGVDFRVQPASDLTTEALALAAPAASWGQDVTINYTLANRGAADAPAFEVGVYLSASGPIASTNTRLTTLHVGGLAAGATYRGSVTVPLPSAPPAGFHGLTTADVGFLIDPSGALAHNDPAGGGNRGLGIDSAALAVAPNAGVGAGVGVQQMPSVAIDPADPTHLVVAEMDSSLVATGYAGIGVAVSRDGGATWQHTSIALPAGFDQGAAAPTVRFDGPGHVLVSFMAATYLGADRPAQTNPSSTLRHDGFSASNGIFVARSDDGGLTWGAPVAVESHAFDPVAQTPVIFAFAPTFAADTHATLPDGRPNPNFGALYAAWARAYPTGLFPGHPDAKGGTEIRLAVSRDGGATWTAQTQTDPATGATVSVLRDPDWGENGAIDPGRGFVLYPQLSVGPEGDLYVGSYGANDFTVYHSTDGGATFRAPDRGNQLGLPFFGLLNNPYGTLLNDSFRTNPVRDIAADPAHPGRVYVVEANTVVSQVTGNPIDAGEVLFAVSNDYGLTWQTIFQVGNETTNLADLPPGQNDTFTSVLNDDDSGRDTAFDSASQLTSEVLSGQALPSLTVDDRGNLTVIWYDTRRDPQGQKLDVFGTVSTDGGRTFTPNFRVTDTSFDPNAGAFTDALGGTSAYLGDRIGVAAADGVAYAVWTDTRNGGQDVYGQSYRLTPAPRPLPDRLAPNDTAATATDLGAVTAPQVVPALIATADPAWFRLQAGASGVLDVSATTGGGDGSGLQVELTDGAGNPVPFTATPALDASGAAVGTQVVAPSVAGQTFLVRVSAAGSVAYSLTLGALTADLGASVEGAESGALAPAGQDVYRLVAGVGGSLALTFTPGGDAQGNLTLRVVGGDGQTVLASGASAGSGAGAAQTVNLAVRQGEAVLLEVGGADPTAAGSYLLQFVNLDQYETPGAALDLPTTGAPASVAAADLTGSGRADLIVSSTGVSDPLNVLAGNGDGTYQAPRQVTVGPGLSTPFLSAGNRQVGVADFNGDGKPDLAVPNFRAGNVSILLGNGDGTFQPQRRFDAVPSPDSLVTGDFNGDGKADVAVLENYAGFGGPSQVALLLGRGDGTFRPAIVANTVFTNGAGPMVVGDFNGDGKPDLIVFSGDAPVGQLFLGAGDGPFRDGGVFSTGEDVSAAEAVALGGKGPGLIVAGNNSGAVYLIAGNGDGTFRSPLAFNARPPRPGDGITVGGLAVVGLPSTVSGSARGGGLTTIAGTPGVYVTATPRSGAGAAEVRFLPAVLDAGGVVTGLGAPAVLGQFDAAGTLAAFTEHGQTDLVVAGRGDVHVLSGVPTAAGAALPPNDTPATARDLGAAPHLETIAQAIVAGHEDAYFTYTVPREAAVGSVGEVLDVSALFRDLAGAGLQVEARDANGNLLGSGARFRVAVAQGEVVTLHVFGLAGTGAGVYTLDLDVLPQLVSVQAESPLPGAPITSLVLTFQGDRLDPAAALDPANYTVTRIDPTGDRTFTPSSGDGAPVVYDPNCYVHFATGLLYPTAVRQTVTLLFAQPLPPGTYQVTLSPAIRAADLGAGEGGRLAGGPSFDGHPLVGTLTGTINPGTSLLVPNLVPAPAAAPATDPRAVAQGTPFLLQLDFDLGALLDAALAAKGDDPTITAAINAQIAARFAAQFAGSGASASAATSYVIFWLDPVSLDLVAPQGGAASYSLASGHESGGGQAFVSVGGNVELVVMANQAGTFNLDVANVPSEARGGAVVLNPGGSQSYSFTAGLRDGEGSFSVSTGTPSGGGATGPNAPGGTATVSAPGASDPAGAAATAGAGASLAATPGAAANAGGPQAPGAGAFSPATTSALATLLVGATLSGFETTSGATENAGGNGAAAPAATAGATGGAPINTPTSGLSAARGQSASTEPETAPQEEPPDGAWRALVGPTLRSMKGAVRRASKTLGVLGWSRWSSLLQVWEGLLDALMAPPNPSAKPPRQAVRPDSGAGPSAGPAAPAPPADPAAPGAGVKASGLWDLGLDRLADVGAGPGPGAAPPEDAPPEDASAFGAVMLLTAAARPVRTPSRDGTAKALPRAPRGRFR